jgi:hypothetical protein
MWQNGYTASCAWGKWLFLAKGASITIHDGSPDAGIADPDTRVIHATIEEELLVCSMVANEEYLFTADHTDRIGFWAASKSELGLEYTLVKRICPSTPSFTGGIMRSLIIWDGFMWWLSDENIHKRNMNNGETFCRRIKFVPQEMVFTNTFVWRGAMFVHGWNKKPIRMTPYTIWSPSTHKSFTKRERQGIKTMVMLAKNNAFPSVRPPMDILYIIFEYLTVLPFGEEFIDDVEKRYKPQ